MEQSSNQVFLRGSLLNLPEFSHENHGKRFFRFFLEVPRLSGAADILPVITEEGLLNAVDLSGGEMVAVSGQIRSHNQTRENRRKLLIFVFASCICTDDGKPANECTLEGILCREPTYRRTPLGREICDLMLAVPRAFRRADYLPCILWGRIAQQGADLHIRNRIRIQGRLQSRIYTKVTEQGAEERTAYEISALSADFLDDTI